MKTKVSLIAAFSYKPELLLLDDPTLGLDAVVLDEYFETLQEVCRDQGTTVFIASHNIEELEKIATHVGFLQEGAVLISDALQSLKMRTRGISMTFKDEPPKLHIDQFKTTRASGRRLSGVVM